MMREIIAVWCSGSAWFVITWRWHLFPSRRSWFTWILNSIRKFDELGTIFSERFIVILILRLDSTVINFVSLIDHKFVDQVYYTNGPVILPCHMWYLVWPSFFPEYCSVWLFVCAKIHWKNWKKSERCVSLTMFLSFQIHCYEMSEFGNHAQCRKLSIWRRFVKTDYSVF